jgi:plastocyanin
MRHTKLIAIAICTLLIIALAAFFIFRGNREKPQNIVGSQSTPTPQVTRVPEPTVPPIKDISLTINGFVPSIAKIRINDVVTWNNESGGSAIIASDPHPDHSHYKELNLGLFENGTSVQTQFTRQGTYFYHNHSKPDQKGTIIVE